MGWEPESFTREQRSAAAKTVVRAQCMVDRLDRSEFGDEHTETVGRVYSRVDDLLSMLYEDVYGLDGSGEEMPQPPRAS